MCYQEFLGLSIGDGREVLDACLSDGWRVAAHLCMCYEVQNLLLLWLLESSREARCEVDLSINTISGVAGTQVVQSLCDEGSEPHLPLAFKDPEAMIELSGTVGRPHVHMYENHQTYTCTDTQN